MKTVVAGEEMVGESVDGDGIGQVEREEGNVWMPGE